MYLPDTARPRAKGYSEAGASITRRALKSFRADSGSPNEDINYNNATLRQRARMLYMAAPVAASAINTNRTKVVGVGLTLKSAVDRDVLNLSSEDAKAWQRRTEAEFRLWCKPQNCDALGLNGFAGLQQLVLKSWLMSGDVFVLLKWSEPTQFNPYALRLHVIEADRISTPHAYGAYYISNTYPRQITADKQEWTRVKACSEHTGLPNILHIMDAERPDQYRGVSYLAPVIEPMLQLRRYTESELMAALVQSLFTAWIQTSTNQAETPFDEVGAGDIGGIPGEVASGEGRLGNNLSWDDREYEMGPGTVLHLAPGESVQFGNPNIPTAGFETFVKTVCKLIGAGLEQPYDVLVKEFNASYSASRAALLEAWEGFKMRRARLVEVFCQPVYEAWMAEAVARDRVRAPGFWVDPLIRSAWCGAGWIGPVQGSLDPKKEAEANLLLIDRGIKTHEQVTRETSGGDWEENIEQLARENAALAAAGGSRVTLIQSDPPQTEEERRDHHVRRYL